MLPGAYAGFCPFRRHHRAVTWLGYGTGVGIYLLGYLLVASAFASVLPFGGVVPIAAAATIAALVSGSYLGWLYGHAVGSPYGNGLLALVAPALIPRVVYTNPFPETTVLWETLNHAAVVLPAGVAGLFAALWSIDRAYAELDDPAAWEREVMPYGLRVAGDEYVDEQPVDSDERTANLGEATSLRPAYLFPLTTLAALDREADLRLSVRGWLASLVVVAPAIALALYGQVTYDDDAFSGVMLLAMLVMLHWSLRVEQRDEERAN